MLAPVGVLGFAAQLLGEEGEQKVRGGPLLVSRGICFVERGLESTKPTFRRNSRMGESTEFLEIKPS